ncbi:MAG: hypothetical protein R3181_08400 [Rubricoccaceae bacterium]|nr:hypothetical protein [Rubricoccaceae bacterium]
MRHVLLLSAFVVLAGTADAQVYQGLQELNGGGAFTSFDGGSIFTLSASYGYFVTRSVELGPTLQVTRSDAGSFSTTSGVVGGFGHLHFGGRRSRSVPFLGLEIGAAVGDAEGVLFGVVGGGKFFVAEGAALTPAAFFQFDDNGNSQFGARAGVSAFF